MDPVYRAMSETMPKTRLRPENRHAADAFEAEKIRFWTANPGVYEAAALCAEQ